MKEICSKLQQNLEESLLSRILNAVEIFMKGEESLPRINRDNESCRRFRDLIHFFLSQTKDFDILSPNYATLLHFIVKHGDIESFKSLLDNKANFDVNVFSSKGTTLMHIVAINGTCEMVQTLLDRGANINIRTGTNEAVHQHLGYIDEIDEKEGYTPLHCAAYAGNLDVLEMLLDKGADIDALSYYGTPLHFACGEINGNLEHDYLLKRKSYWSEGKIITDDDRVKIVKTLLKRGAKVDLTDSNNKSPLQRACFNYNIQAIQALLEHIAPV